MQKVFRGSRVRGVVRFGIVGAIGVAMVFGAAGCGGSGGDGETTGAPGAPKTTAPAPSGGNVTETVPPVKVETKAPAALTKPVDVDGAVTVKLAKVEQITVKAVTPGEVAGPAVSVTVTIENTSKKAVDLTGVAVMMTQGNGAAGTATTSSPAAPFTGSVEPGKTAKGVYVFNVQGQAVNPITVQVSYLAGTPTAIFTGDVAK